MQNTVIANLPHRKANPQTNSLNILRLPDLLSLGSILRVGSIFYCCRHTLQENTGIFR